MTQVISQSTLERLGHNFDPHRVLEDVRLRRCRGCGRIWRFKPAHNSFDAVAYLWLKLLEPTGWTMTFDLPFEPDLDEVSHLSPIEMLLWKRRALPRPANPRLPRRNRKRRVSTNRFRCFGRGQRQSRDGRFSSELTAIC